MRRNRTLSQAALLILAALLFVPQISLSAEAKKTVSLIPPEKVVIATVGKRKITLAEFNKLFEGMPDHMKFFAASRKAQMIQHMAFRYLMLEYARKRRIDRKKEVRGKLEEARREVLVRESVRAIEAAAVPTEADLKAEYGKNKSRYTEGGKVAASHILVGSEEEAKKIVAELKKGADFARLSKERSLAPDREKGGALGTFGRGHHKGVGLPAIVEETAFSLKPGSFSEPVRSRFGWHIVLTHKKLEGKQLSYAEARGRIRDAVWEAKRKAALGRALAELQKVHPVKIYADRIP